MSQETERRLSAEQKKLDALRTRIVQVTYLKGPEVRRHLNMSRATLEQIPMAVLPWVPGQGVRRVERRYNPADVAAYPARARRWRDAQARGVEEEVLAAMQQELEERDRALIEDALKGLAA
jgi:hypothetical protein